MADFSYYRSGPGNIGTPEVGDIFGYGTPWVAKFTISVVFNDESGTCFFDATGVIVDNIAYTTADLTKAMHPRTPIGYGIRLAGKITVGGVPLEGVSGLGWPTDIYGNYLSNTFVSPYNGTLTPIKLHYIFTPVNRTYSGLSLYRSGEDYTAVLHPPAIEPTDYDPITWDVTLNYPNLSWIAGDYGVAFDVWFGTSWEGMTKVSNKQIGLSWTIPLGTLQPDTIYKWRIDSYNDVDEITEGTEQEFITLPLPSIELVSPDDGETDVKAIDTIEVSIVATVISSKLYLNGLLVYTGTLLEWIVWNKLLQRCIDGMCCNPETSYSWYVIINTVEYGELTSDTWSFTTSKAPTKPKRPTPRHGSQTLSGLGNLNWIYKSS